MTTPTITELYAQIGAMMANWQGFLDQQMGWQAGPSSANDLSPPDNNPANKGYRVMVDAAGNPRRIMTPAQMEKLVADAVKQIDDLNPAALGAQLTEVRADVSEISASLSSSRAELTALVDSATSSKNAAASSATAASSSKTAAASSATAAASSATSAASSATAASSSKTAAAASQGVATTKAAESQASAAESANKAADAAVSASTASTKAGEASVSASTASTKAAEAASSATSAASSATAASNSATAAAGSATAAKTSETNANTKASAAATSATSAQKWADNAVDTAVTTGKFSALHHATKAAESAAAAAASASTSLNKASEASGHASSASTSASTATAKASEAASGASTATTKATAAASSATAAASSATAAASSATAAGNSATAAASSATAASSSKTAAASSAAEAAASAQAAREAMYVSTGALIEAGEIDMSGGAYPSPLTDASGKDLACFWKVTTAGISSLDGVDYEVGDTLVYSSASKKFYKIDNTESVQSVNGMKGAVRLTAADVGALGSGATAVAATKLATARTISITGDGTGSASFDGTGNVSISLAVTDDSHAHTFANLKSRPTTLAGYGITDAAALAHTHGDLFQKAGGVITGLTQLNVAGAPTIGGANFDNGWLRVGTSAGGIAIDPNEIMASGHELLLGTLTSHGTGFMVGNVRAGAVKADGLYSMNSKVLTEAAGSAVSAGKLATARTLALTGDAVGSMTFDGSADASMAVTLAKSGVTAGSYTKVTVDDKGRVTSASNQTAADVPNLDWSKIATGRPTDLAGYGVASATLKAMEGLAMAADRAIYFTAAGTAASMTVTSTARALLDDTSAAAMRTTLGAASTSTATTTASGLMSAADKAKLDSVQASANEYVHPASGVVAGSYRAVTVDANGHVTGGSNPTTLNDYGITDAAPSSHVGSGGTAHADATSTMAGFMSAADKAKLDGIAAGANSYVHPTSDGNKHVPATGTTSNGKVLKAGATAGAFSWASLTPDDVGLSNLNNWPFSTTTNDPSDTTYATAGAVKRAADIANAALPKIGGSLTGSVTFTNDSVLQWSRNTDSAAIGFKNSADSDADSFMWFRTSDNGNEYFKWQTVNGTTTTDLMTLKSDNLRIKGDQVYHQGFKPTAAELGVLPSAGTATLVGKLVIQNTSSQIDLVETDSEDKTWRLEASNGELAFTEAGVATRLRLLPGGGVTTSGSVTAGGEVISGSNNSFRQAVGAVGTFWRNDGTNLYLMKTASGDPTGTYDSKRPFAMNLDTGRLTMSEGVTVRNGLEIGTGNLLLNTNSVIGANGKYLLRDHGNGNVTLSASTNAEGVAGELYLGYNSGTTNYTRNIRVETRVTWKAVSELISAEGKLNSSELFGPIRVEKDEAGTFHTIVGGSDTVNRGRTIIAAGEAGRQVFDNTGSADEVVHVAGDAAEGVVVSVGLQNGWGSTTHKKHAFRDDALIINQDGASAKLFMGTSNTYLSRSGNALYLAANGDAGRVYIEGKQDPVARVNGQDFELYHKGNRPTPAEIGAATRTTFYAEANYCSTVILLAPMSTLSADRFGLSRVQGIMRFSRGANTQTERSETLFLDVKTSYNANSYSMSKQGNSWGWKLASCDYNGKKWICLSSATNNSQSLAVIFDGVSSIDAPGYDAASQFLVIAHTRTGDPTNPNGVLNQEIVDSLTDLPMSSMRDSLGGAFYSPNNKPSASDLGVLSAAGGVLSGSVTMNGAGSGITFAGLNTGTGIYNGSKDAASQAGCNLQIKSWYGIGISPSAGSSLPAGENSIWINARNGDINTIGDLYVKTDKRVFHEGFKQTDLPVNDLRGVDRAPSFFAPRSVTGWFNQTGMPTASVWHAGLTVKGWDNSYNAWQLFSNSHTGSSNNILYFRTGNVDTWNATARVFTTLDAPTATDVGLSNVNNWSATAAVNDASDTKYATAGAVKKAYDLAAAALPSNKADVFKSAGMLTDLNVAAAAKPGFFQYGPGAVGAPMSGYGHGLVVSTGGNPGSGNWYQQVVFGHDAKIYTRRGVNSAATGAWARIYTTDDKPSLAELGAAAADHTHTYTYSLRDIKDSPYKEGCDCATTANLASAYANGSSGVGATLTNNSTLAALTIDGVTCSVGMRVLVKNQTSAAQNGIYTVTKAGSTTEAWVLTRTPGCDTSAEAAGAVVTVDQGTENGGLLMTTEFKRNSAIGSTAMNWRVVVDSGNIGAQHHTSGVSAGTYRSVTVNAQGHVTAGSNPTTLSGYGITDAQAKHANLTALAGFTPAADRIPYFTSASAASVTPLTAFARSLLDDNDAAAARATLGVLSIEEPFKSAADVATTANLDATYANGSSGVGATLTGNAPAALSLDGVTVTAGMRVLVKNQTAAAQNGIYTLTTAGSTTVAWVLTRANDADTSAKLAGAVITVDQGTANGSMLLTNDWKKTSTVGTTAMNWRVVIDSGNVSSYHHASGVTAGTYRSVTVNSQGHVTGGTNPTTLSGYGITDAAPSSHVGSGGGAHSVATTSVHGFMSSTDKAKLDSIASNANNYAHPTGDGNLHVPATGTGNNGKYLMAGATAGSLSWQTIDAAEIGAVPVAGGTMSGTLTVNNEIRTTSANSLRMVYGNYGTFWRNDGGNMFLMFTNAGDQYGSYNSLRPMYASLATGNVNFGHAVDVAGNLSVNTGSTSWVDMRVSAALQNRSAVATSSASAIVRQEHADRHFIVGGLGNSQFGFYMINKSRTANGTDAQAFLSSDGTWYCGANVSANDYQVRSDRRLKSEFTEIKDAWELWKSLQISEYTKQGQREYGFIAQDFDKAHKPAVATTMTDDYLNLKPMGVLAIAGKVIQSLQDRVERLESTLKACLERMEVADASTS
ncbi:phage tail fiber protein [Aeromonas caviae]|uniref:phage tail fiber protein n=1 Tax=Aeromonas caviae TaxID=648 RepID=UPI0029D5CCC0|nr:tail fiber domain-containing protein [Aeromonas caviae]MDX7711846.1 tail fiber domain-containing protein [Aeromonas caviae]